jgi:hypothetical protein
LILSLVQPRAGLATMAADQAMMEDKIINLTD